jgi:menaquinone-dependent protoporphyrinogen oxidase
MKLLVAYASAHGSTAEIAQFMGRILAAYDIDVTVANVADVEDVSEYDTFVLGSAVHANIWLQEMLQFIDRFHKQIEPKTCFFFITCIRILEEGGYEHVIREYVNRKLLEALNVREVVAFAGKLEINAVDWDERWLLALRYDGATVPGRFNHDYRDWEAIAKWTISIAKELGAVPFLQIRPAEHGSPQEGTMGAPQQQQTTEYDTEASDVIQF